MAKRRPDDVDCKTQPNNQKTRKGKTMDKKIEFNALEHVTVWAAREFGPAYNEGRITFEEFVKDSLEYIDVIMGFMRDNPESHKSYREILDLHNAGRLNK